MNYNRRNFLGSLSRLASGLFVPTTFAILHKLEAQPGPALPFYSGKGGSASITALVLPDPTGQGTFGGGSSTQFGFQFVTNAQITVTQIGRWKLSGNTDTVTLSIVNGNGSSTLATASLNLNTAPVGMNFVALGTPLTIAAGTYNCWFSYGNDGAAGTFYSCSGGNGCPITSFASPITLITSSAMTGAGYGTFAGNSVYGLSNFMFHL